MNKLKLMSQKTLKDAILYLVDDEPGVASDKLWRHVKSWNEKTPVSEFEDTLGRLRGQELRCANKRWHRPYAGELRTG